MPKKANKPLIIVQKTAVCNTYFSAFLAVSWDGQRSYNEKYRFVCWPCSDIDCDTCPITALDARGN